MNRFRIFLMSLVLAGTAHAASRAEAVMSSRFLVRGEQTKLEIVLSSMDFGEEVEMPDLPRVDGVDIRRLSNYVQRRASEGRRLEHFIPFVVSSLEPGDHEIPSIEVQVEGETHRTRPVKFRVMETSALQWTTVRAGEETIRYAAAFHAMKDRPYVGEKQPVELKIYFPADQIVIDWGIPDFERDGLSAWRFQPQPQFGRAQLLNKTYYAVPYPSTASTNAAGASSIGPATLTMQLQLASVREFGRAYAQPLKLTVPALNFDSQPLPEGAPEGFENAIGNFQLQVVSGETDVREGDPVALELVVSGSGNLDALSPPKLIDADGWKVYAASAMERGEERRELSGQVVFRQFMRPLRLLKAVPPFKLVYFDPDKQSYETVQTEAIPLNVMPSTAAGIMAAPPPQLHMPLEEMSDILGVVNASPSLLPENVRLPWWVWQVLPAAIAVGLLCRIAAIKFAPRMKSDPDTIARRREWKEVESAPDSTFYRKAGHFIERWLGDRTRDPVVEQVLKRRDETSFRRDGAEGTLDRGEKAGVIKQLRRIALPLLAMLAILMPGESRAEGEDAGTLFQDGRYEEAAKAWLESGPYDRLSADTLYNIGNAAYRMGSPGEAALYYRRALARDSAHPESRQNLRFLERKFGSITIQRPDHQYHISRLPLGFWKGLVVGSAWALVIAALLFPATRRGSGWRTTAITLFASAPLVALCGGLAWRHFPDDATFAPLAEQAVVVADSSVVRTAASRTSPSVISAPAGSVCRLVSRSGDWAYVAFTNESRGWLPLVDIRPLVPETIPEPPKPRALEAGENNA